MNFFDYAFHHIGCALRIVRGDARALADMDVSADGFWRSFEAIVAAFPAMLFAWVVYARQIQAEGSLDPTMSIVTRLATLEIALWILPVIVLAVILPPLGFRHRFSHFIIARNWLGAALAYLFVIVSLAQLVLERGGEQSPVTMLLALIAIAVAFMASLRVTIAALATTGGIAFMFVFAEWVALIFIELQAMAVMGLLPEV
ncbi:hypothetical protein [Oricola sp.]|uniref:hypothetical protein n=1 Tax=Oricola sp. TaxID=1979950 RepID=UPI003BAC740E